MQDLTWVADQVDFDQLLNILQQQPIVAVDTESDSLYSYFDKVCLVQMSINDQGTIQDFVIDPLVVDITPLENIFVDETIEKIFHAAEYDVMTLRRDYGFQFNNLFDTMVAARLLEWPKSGLGAVLAAQFQVKLNKRFQQYNWGQRPLSAEALQYARLDTHYLLPLRQRQYQALQKQDSLQEAQVAFAQEAQVKMMAKIFQASRCRRIKQRRTLSRRQQKILQELYTYRDEIGRWTDTPPFKVISDSTLSALARKAPQSISELKQIKGLNHRLIAEHGDRILNLLVA